MNNDFFDEKKNTKENDLKSSDAAAFKEDTAQFEEAKVGSQSEIEFSSREALEAKLNEVETESNRLKEQLLRTQAEMENVQKRYEKRIADIQKYAIQGFTKELLGVVDVFERAMVESTDQSGGLYEGVLRTHALLLTTLAKFGLKVIDPKSEKFNPECHEAISTVLAENEAQFDQVIQVLQKGYFLNERLIRPALVIVASRS